MKLRFFSVVMMLLSSEIASCQDWIGDVFRLDTIVPLVAHHTPRNMNLVKCRIFDSCFYFIEQQGFQYDRGKEKFAVIYGISLKNYAQSEIKVPSPIKERRETGNKSMPKGELWIYDFDFYEDLLLVTTQEEILVYKKDVNSEYKLLYSDNCHNNLHTAFIESGRLHYLEEDHDTGFRWFHKKLGGDSATFVRELNYEAPHVVQIQPNRYLFHDKKNVYFLSTRHPRMEIYSKTGEFQKTVEFGLPNWKSFNDDYIRRTLTKPYGVERILSVKDDIFAYSYPKLAYPFDGGLMLFYLQFDTTIGKSVLQYAILDHDKQIQRYSFNHDNSRYVAAQFPFDLFRGSYDKGNSSYGNSLVQLTYFSDITWNNKTDEEYKTELNNYFENNKAKVAYKIMEFIGNKKKQYSLDGNKSNSDTISRLTRSVYIVHGDFECSGCVKSIYQLMNMTECQFDIHQIYRRPIVGIYCLEVKNSIGQILKRDFNITSIEEVEKNGLNIPRLSDTDFPCIIFHNGSDETRTFKISEIFTENISLTEYRKDFLEFWESFFHDSQ